MLSGQDAPIVKSLRLGNQMPFADNRSLVTSGLQQFRKGLLVAVESAGIVCESVDVAEFARQDASP